MWDYLDKMDKNLLYMYASLLTGEQKQQRQDTEKILFNHGEWRYRLPSGLSGPCLHSDNLLDNS